MKFYVDADKSLSLLPSGVADGEITLTAQLFDGERELWSKKISTYADEIKAVALRAPRLFRLAGTGDQTAIVNVPRLAACSALLRLSRWAPKTLQMV